MKFEFVCGQIINLILLTAFHIFARSRGPNTSAPHFSPLRFLPALQAPALTTVMLLPDLQFSCDFESENLAGAFVIEVIFSESIRKEWKITTYIVKLALVGIGVPIRATDRCKKEGTNCVATFSLMRDRDFHIIGAIGLCFISLKNDDIMKFSEI